MTNASPTNAVSGEIAAPGEIAAAIGRIPSGLFVVTWLDPVSGGDRAMLASWVMQAGFDPPAISLAVAASRGLAAAIEAGLPFVVNLLAESQRSMVGRFGRPATPAVPGQGGGYDPFDGLSVDRAPCGAAILSPASGWLECSGASGISGGSAITVSDHRVIVAVVRAAGSSPGIPQAPDDAPIVHLRKNGLRY